MSKIILGFCGRLSSGKGTACSYLEKKYKAKTIMFSQSLRDILNRLYLEVSRSNLQKLSLLLRQGFSQDIFSQVVYNDVQKAESDVICIDGIRRPKDLHQLKDIKNFYLVSIKAEPELRWKRITQRQGQNIDDNKKSFIEFQQDELAEAETLIDKTSQEADYFIDNNGDQEDLYKQIDDILLKLYKNNSSSR
jgi:dephospho-CoA kinase